MAAAVADDGEVDGHVPMKMIPEGRARVKAAEAMCRTSDKKPRNTAEPGLFINGIAAVFAHPCDTRRVIDPHSASVSYEFIRSALLSNQLYR
jgi:hypothetical protein